MLSDLQVFESDAETNRVRITCTPGGKYKEIIRKKFELVEIG